MKKLLICLLVLPLAALAGPREDYARQWPLTLGRDDGGAYRVVLDAQVYRTATTPSLQDVDVINAQGQAVPADVFAPEAPLAVPARRIPVAWFSLPASTNAATADLSVIAQRDAQGRILSVQAHTGPTTASASALLLDLSRVREPVEALEIEWRDAAAVSTAWRVETSDNLQDWYTTRDRLQLLDLQQNGQRLRHNEVPLIGPVRYVRLTPLDVTPTPSIAAVQARLPATRTQARRAHESLQGRKVAAQGRDYYEFELQGHFPVVAADIEGSGNAAVEWVLESRAADSAAWQRRTAPWVAWRIASQGDARVSQPQSLGGAPVRDRYWRLHATTGTPAEAPTLQLLYAPEVIVFLAQGDGPYALVAGSGKARRAAAPMPQLVQALRRDQGDDWHPTPAYPGQAQPLAGEGALVPSSTPVDWTGWLLWSLLLGGAVLVAAMGISLLRRQREQAD